MHKQSQRQERTRRIICRFQDLGCLREALNSGLSVDGRASTEMSPTPPHPPADEPRTAQAHTPVGLCIISSEGSTSPDNPGGGMQLPIRAPHTPPHTNPGHMLTARSIFHAVSTHRDLIEQRQPQDGPRAKVTMNWEVTAYSACSPPNRDPRAQTCRGQKEPKETQSTHQPNKNNAGTALKPTRWHLCQQEVVLLGRETQDTGRRGISEAQDIEQEELWVKEPQATFSPLISTV